MRFGGLGQCRGIVRQAHGRPNMTIQRKATTKAAMVTKILSREKGATLLEISKATGWQQHSCRAFLTGLRKRGEILKEQRSDGQLSYRIAQILSRPEQADAANND